MRLYTLDNQFIEETDFFPDNFTGILVNIFGDKIWFVNGKRHRIDGPAIECANESKYWYLNDKYHREDGPAVDHPYGTKEWYFNGKEYTEEQHKLYVDLMKLKGLL